MADRKTDAELEAHYRAVPDAILVRLFRGHARERAAAERAGADPLRFHERRVAIIARELERRGLAADVDGGLFPR